jgi:hypothetical protein
MTNIVLKKVPLSNEVKQNPRTVTVEKKDLEAAIKEGLISVETGTALWVKWKVLPAGKDSSEFSNVEKIINLQKFTTEKIIYCFGAISLVAAFFAAMLFLWVTFGIKVVSVAALLGAIVSFFGGNYFIKNNKPIKASIANTSCIVLSIFFTWSFCRALGYSSSNIRQKIDMFGPIPQKAPWSTVLIELSGVAVSLIIANKNKLQYYWFLASLVFIIFFGDLIFIGLSHLQDSTSMKSWCLLLSACIVTMTAFFYQKKSEVDEKKTRAKWIGILSFTFFWCGYTYYIFEGSLGAGYYLLANAAIFIIGNSLNNPQIKLSGLIGFYLALGLLFFGVSGIHWIWPALLITLGLASIGISKNMTFIKKQLSIIYKKIPRVRITKN